MEKKKNVFSLFQWWKIDDDELTKQIVNYDSLGWWASARTMSVSCLLFSALVTSVFVVSKLADSSSLLDVFIMLAICPFMLKGNKTSFLLAMLYWTFAKAYGIVASPTFLVTSLIWWAFYMRCFYLAFRVERDKALVLQKNSVRPTNNYPDPGK